MRQPPSIDRSQFLPSRYCGEVSFTPQSGVKAYPERVLFILHQTGARPHQTYVSIRGHFHA